MATRALNVVITGDSKGIGIAAREADGHLRAVQRSAKLTGDAVKLGFGVAAAGAVIGVGFLKKSVDAAKEAETSHARLVAQLKASGISYHAHGKQIDEVIQKHSKLAGIDDEDLQDAFTSLVRSTGSVSKSMKDMGLVTDIARGKHIDVTKAADLLGKVHAGNTSILKRYGIAIDPVTKAQDKLKDSHKKATDEQIKAAKAADKTATSQKALAELQKRFGGQAEAYGKTAAGAQERFGVALENVQEKLGAKLLPVLAKVAGGVATFLQGMDSGKGVGGAFANAISTGFNTVKTVIQRVIGAVRGYLQDHRADIQSVIQAFKRVAEFAKTTWQETLLPIIKRTVGAIKPIMQGLTDVIRGVVRLVSGLLSGNWSKAWSGAKEVVSGAFKAIKTVVTTEAGNLGEIVKDLGPKLVKLIVKGVANLGKALATGIFEGIKAAASAVPGLAAGALKGIGHAITSGISKGFGALNPFGGDGVGKMQIGGGDFGGGLHGANPALGGVASLAGKFGLSISAGRTDHNRLTSSGNVSYHSSGEALDFSNGVNTPAERGFQKFMHDRFGGRIAELIGPVPSLNLKDGHPFPYDSATQAQHKNHVHVALDLGHPGIGIGDGLGKFSGDGIGQAVQAARAAGFRGEALVDAVAIAGAESGYIANRKNLKYPDHSIGMWQINQLAHHGRYGSDSALTNPFTNARAAWAISGHGRSFGPWSTWPGAASSWLARARAAVGGSGGKSSAGGSSGGGKKPLKKNQTSTVTGGRYDPTVVYPDKDAPSDEQIAAGIFRQKVAGTYKPPAVAKGFTADDRPAAAGGDGGDPNQPLIDAINAKAEQDKALAAEVQGLKDEMKATRAFAEGVANTSNFQLTKDLSDMVSGRIVGYGVAGRAFTPGTGVEVAY